LKIFEYFEFESKSLEYIFENNYASLPIQFFNLAQKFWQPNLIFLWKLPCQPKPLRPLVPSSGHPGPFLPPWTLGTAFASPDAPPPRAPPCAALRHVREAEPKHRSRRLHFPSSIDHHVDSHPFASMLKTIDVILHHRPIISSSLRLLSSPIKSTATSSILRYTSSHPRFHSSVPPSATPPKLVPPPLNHLVASQVASAPSPSDLTIRILEQPSTFWSSHIEL
jgi:hypothetical protein